MREPTTKKTRVSPSFSRHMVVWDSPASEIVIEAHERRGSEWTVVSFRPEPKPPEGTPIDDLVAELQAAGLDMAKARREWGENLEKAGDTSLRALRLKAGLSQRELGERTGMPQSNVARLENEPGNPSLATLRKLAAALGIDLNTLARAFP